jgi:hypothetical protein
MIDLARMLIQACAETIDEGLDPELDPAVSVISGRIGFLSPAGDMTHEEWKCLLAACAQRDRQPLKLTPEAIN